MNSFPAVFSSYLYSVYHAVQVLNLIVAVESQKLSEHDRNPFSC